MCIYIRVKYVYMYICIYMCVRARLKCKNFTNIKSRITKRKLRNVYITVSYGGYLVHTHLRTYAYVCVTSQMNCRYFSSRRSLIQQNPIETTHEEKVTTERGWCKWFRSKLAVRVGRSCQSSI